MSICLKEFGVVCALGQSKQQVFENLVASNNSGLVLDELLPMAEPQYVGRVNISASPEINAINTRNNQLAYLAYQQIADEVQRLSLRYSKHRIAVIIGTSTSGILEGEKAHEIHQQQGQFPSDYHYKMQEMVAPAHFIADLAQAQGPVYSISTACSSSGKALVSAKALIESGIADVVIAGGVDSLSKLTVNGFKSLESIASGRCQPFCQNRDGINIGEAAALFVLCKDDKGIMLLGAGESSDAYHMSSPSPDGDGAYRAMQAALTEAGIRGEDVDYVNLHGTATIKNDEMEAKAMFNACGSGVLCSSTKGLTGHTLGAAGALEIGLCWLLLSDYNKDNFIPENVCQALIDPAFSNIALSKGENIDQLTYCMSNSFAFGGSNFSVVLGKTYE